MFNNKLKEASKTMIAGGVHPKYVKRTVQELRDHFNDLKDNLIRNGVGEAEAAREAEEKIGNLHNIATESVNKKELKSWISLHPKTTFLAGPLVGFILAIISMLAVIFVIAAISESTGQVFAYPYPVWFVAFLNTLVFFNMYLLPGLLGALFAYLARDRMVPARLVMFSVIIAAVICSVFAWRVNFPQGPEKTGSFYASLSFLGFMPLSSDGFRADLMVESLFRMALAFGAAAAVWWRFKKASWLEGRQGE